MDELLEAIDWQSLAEFIEPAIGLLIALLFMGFVRLMRASRRRRPSAETSGPTVATPPRQASSKKVSKRTAGHAVPIEPGDNAAELSERFSQQPPGR